MIPESELVRFILGLAAIIILILSRTGLQRLPGYRLFALAYYLLFAGWIFTIVEHLLLPVLFNVFEHFSYAASSLLYLLFCLRLRQRARR